MFETMVREPTLTGRVVNQLEALIVDRRLQPGDRLPAINELAQQFGVSRTVIREAIGALAAKGLLEVRHGSRTMVSRPSAETVAQSMSHYLRTGRSAPDIAKVSHVRRVLEIEIAGCAAQQRTQQDLTRLETLLAEMTTIVQATDNRQLYRTRYAQTDVDFHTALAYATGNDLFPMMLNSLVDVMMEVREMGFTVPGSLEKALNFHSAIYEQVKAGNAEGARQAMRAHLLDSEEVMRQASALTQEQS
jgi:GntR family transcriptional regulator, transcriptional repressor for pyruvate dehydrogenase complex